MKSFIFVWQILQASGQGTSFDHGKVENVSGVIEGMADRLRSTRRHKPAKGRT